MPLKLKKHPDIARDNGLGRSRGGFGTKIHLATDGSCLPLNIVPSPGEAHGSQLAQRFLDGIGVQCQNGSMKRRGYAVLADKADSGRTLRNELKNKGIKVVMPENQMRRWHRIDMRSLIVMRTAIAISLNDALGG